MLPNTIDRDADLHFPMVDTNNGRFHMLFVSKGTLKQNPFFPHWVRECADERTLEGIGRWFAARRDRWQGWGELAERIGIDAFYEHMAGLLDAEPLEEVVATTVTRLDDARAISLGEMLCGKDGQRMEALHVHLFATPELRDRFFDWFYTDMNCQLAQPLLNIGWCAGGVELSRALDDIAAGQPEPKRRQPRGRRRGGAKKRVHA